MHLLGYPSYVCQSGDWGSFIGRELGSKYSACKAVHFNFCPVEIPSHLTDLTPREDFIKKRAQSWLDDHLGYAVLMRTRPQTFGVALHDNPMGILAFVGEKYIEACHPSLVTNPSKEWDEAILTTCSLYYFSGCIMTASLPYYEGVKHDQFGTFFQMKENYIDKPMGYTSFLYDTRPGTKRGVDETGRLVFYNGMHFLQFLIVLNSLLIVRQNVTRAVTLLPWSAPISFWQTVGSSSASTTSSEALSAAWSAMPTMNIIAN
jgi:hypothetical protein